MTRGNSRDFGVLEDLWGFKGLWRTGGTEGLWRTGGNWRAAHSGGSSPSTHLEEKLKKKLQIYL